MYYLCHRKPFSDMPTSVIIPVLDGQIRRGHALIAMQGPRAVGYFGWALFTIEEALTQGLPVTICVGNADLDVLGRVGALLRY